VDAVVPGGALTLELAEELERLRPFGSGNPQPALLVPGARVENVAAMGEERQHARFTLVTAGGSRSRGVAFGSAPGSLAPAADAPHDVVLRLERNSWNGIVEPRIRLRAMCPTPRGEVRELGAGEPFWLALADALAEPEPVPVPAAMAGGPRLVDRRGGGFAGVVGELLSSGERVLVGVADVPRRRESLAALVAGLADGGLPVVSWSALARRPGLAGDFDQLVALDPPPRGAGDPLLGTAPRAHLAWSPADVEFALAVWRSELELRPSLANCFRALRELDDDAPPAALEAALRGDGRHPRPPHVCARLLSVLAELGLVEHSLYPPRCRAVEGARTRLELSTVHRRCAERYAELERRFASERLPRDGAAVARAS
jgi:single-stranded-DNA-specific exonuclease